ncbi:MAG: AAA family ATPase, partial [Gemmatimonadetes bacterium]|nr:AAA family ATPase [Gemmatimonadota bacterium]NIR79441.1 AAA family ATPase [Gemmatimonadota bacterium]NIT87305.1 AAA family ATPase [Gemmatimonadota bacterium]NIU31149.1 AAA family ATPase [Gemmatimonadota bacterium]NIU35875.1 AAA family ATPase [Gemmatimonadota bacterium]
MRSLSGAERQARGRAILDLRGRGRGEALEGHLVKLLGRPGKELPDTEILVGDLVMVSRGDPLRGDNPTGTVTEKTGYSLTVAFDGRPASFVTGKGLRVDLYVNDITYRRMLEALGRLRAAGGRLGELRDVLVGAAKPAEPEAEDPDRWHDPALNTSQRRAVARALGAPDLFLVHGPPGTGKTTTVLEVVRQHAARGRSVLATAASNMAVDNVVEVLAERGVDVVRVGHPARVTPALRAHTLDALLRENETWRASRELREEAFARKEDQEELTHPSGRHRRGMPNARILELAERGRGNRGVPPRVVREMAEWIQIQEEADELFERSRELEDAAIGEVLDAADVVCSTNSTAGSDLLAGRSFDVVVIDEATQATEP